MPKIQTFISTGSVRTSGPGAGASATKVQSNRFNVSGAKVDTGHIGQIRDVLYTPLVDKVGVSEVTNSAEKAAKSLYEASLSIADKEHRVKATEATTLASQEIKDLLYSRDDALYKKTGVEFLRSANTVKNQVVSIFKKHLDNLSPAERSYAVGYVLSEQNRILTNISKNQVTETNRAHEAIKTKALSDLTAGLSFVQSTGDLEQLIQAATSTILEVSPKDANVRKSIAREIYNGAFENYLGILTKRGTTPQQRVDSANLAMSYLGYWKTNPNHDATLAATVERNIASALYSAQNQADADLSREWNKAELLSRQLYASKTAKWLKAYDENDLEAMSQIELSVRDLAHSGQFKHLGKFSQFKQQVKSGFNEYNPSDARKALELLDRTEEAGVMQEFLSTIDRLPPQMQITFTQSALGHRRQAVSNSAQQAKRALYKYYVDKVPSVLTVERKRAEQLAMQGVSYVIEGLKKSITLPDGSVEYPDFNKVLKTRVKSFIERNPATTRAPQGSKDFQELTKPTRFEKTLTYLETGKYTDVEAERKLRKDYAKALSRIKTYDGDRVSATADLVKYYAWTKQRLEQITQPDSEIEKLLQE